MKRNYIYLACMTVCMFALFAISSCSNEMDMPSSKIEHLQKMKQLCAQYGWTQIEGVSQEEVDKFLLSEDYEKTKEFFEFVKTGGETINLTSFTTVQFFNTGEWGKAQICTSRATQFPRRDINNGDDCLV